jgi:glucose/arabinose dehydrogenase
MQDVRRIRTVLFLIVFSILLGVPIRLGFAQEINLNGIKLPPGFEISVYASRIHGARSMALGNKGTLFVGSRSEGKVYAITDRNKDNKADEVITIASGLNSPNGVAFTDGSLYVAEISRILRFDDVENSLHNPPKPVVVNDSFPKEKHHG